MKAGLQRLLNRVGYSLHRKSRIDAMAMRIERQRYLIDWMTGRIRELNTFVEQDDRKIADLMGSAHPAAKEARFRQIIGTVSARYFIKRERTPDISIPFDQVTLDSMPEWIPYLLERPELSEPEFSVFQFFSNPDETVLDVGAHFGYSATSIWRAGCPAKILSFEPNPWQQTSLQRIKDLKPGQFDFLGVGVGNARGSMRFVIPVVEGVGIGGLCSAAIEREMDWAIPENLLRHMLKYAADVPSPRLQFAEAHWEVAPLDEILESGSFAVPITQIAAIKIDVEGLEDEAIEGAARTLQRHRPMLMVEGANRVPAVFNRLARLGYCYAEFNDGTVYLTDEASTRIGGFYLHETRLDEYRDSGLLVAAPQRACERVAVRG
jgi:FkbM family methyltransferase